MIGELSASEQKLAAVMIVELTETGRSALEVEDIVEGAVLEYRRLRVGQPLWSRIRRLAVRAMFPFGR